MAISLRRSATAVPPPIPAAEALSHLTENYSLPLSEGNFAPANSLHVRYPHSASEQLVERLQAQAETTQASLDNYCSALATNLTYLEERTQQLQNRAGPILSAAEQGKESPTIPPEKSLNGIPRDLLVYLHWYLDLETSGEPIGDRPLTQGNSLATSVPYWRPWKRTTTTWLTPLTIVSA